jgi:2-(1,2-epoxy-1,2-dihydrophenyl)acetyl-CoA isomerase
MTATSSDGGGNSDGVLCEVRDGVAVVTLNRPQAVNALNEPLRVGLRYTLQRVSAAPEVRAIVLTGAGRGFSAGADLKEFTVDASQVDRQLAGQYHPAVRTIMGSPKPVIAAVEGFVSGIAGAFVLAADLVVMSEGRSCTAVQTIAHPDGGLCFVARRWAQRAFEMAIEKANAAPGWG